MSGSKQPTVHRSYRPEPDYCTRALVLLLEKTVRITTTEPTQPDGPNDAAKVRNVEGVTRVEQRLDGPSEGT